MLASPKTANIAMNTQKELTAPAIATAAEPEQQAADQIDARAGAVDEEADRRLQHRRHHVEGGEREAELGVADAVVRPDEQEQRRQQHHVVMAHQVREAHAGDELGLARRRGGEDFGDWSHCC